MHDMMLSAQRNILSHIISFPDNIFHAGGLSNDLTRSNFLVVNNVNGHYIWITLILVWALCSHFKLFLVCTPSALHFLCKGVAHVHTWL